MVLIDDSSMGSIARNCLFHYYRVTTKSPSFENVQLLARSPGQRIGADNFGQDLGVSRFSNKEDKLFELQ